MNTEVENKLRNSKLRVRGAHSRGIDTDRSPSPPPDLLFEFELSFGLKAENTAFTRGWKRNGGSERGGGREEGEVSGRCMCIIGTRREIKNDFFQRIGSIDWGALRRVLNNAWNLFPGIESLLSSPPGTGTRERA